jgi:poly-gamma-glutamate capsule biosynthesis protein CapA/YwtB (metallophosphatase superfamily)
VKGRLGLVVVIVSVALTGCGRALAQPASTGPAAGPEVTLAFAGDVHFMKRTADLLANPATAFGPITATLSAADLAMANLETPITDRGTAEPKRYLFRAGRPAVEAIRAAGIDAVSLANNHTLDYGRVGLADTIDAAKAGGLVTFGAGNNRDQAFTPWRTTVRGVRIAVFGFSQVDDLANRWAATDIQPGIAMAFDVKRAVAAVTAARADSDLVIVFPHWGTEGSSCVNGDQKRLAAKLAAAGADIIVGAHAHVLQGSGWLNHTYVAFGLGNFLWYSPGLTP